MTAAPLKQYDLHGGDCAGRDSPRLHDRGPIEAYRRAVGAIVMCSLRGYMTAAPLKRSDVKVPAFRPIALRGYMTAAPLKLFRYNPLAVIFGSLRGYMTAAPLKRKYGITFRPLCGNSPRLHDRGPIEAPPTRAAFEISISSPRLHDRGPIEAMRRTMAIAWIEGSPRLHDRGPIEANFLPDPHAHASLPLRGYMTAAPLKQRGVFGP